MTSVKQHTHMVLRIFSETLERLTEEELSELIKGNATLVFQAVDSSRSHVKTNTKTPTKVKTGTLTQKRATTKSVNIAPIVEPLLQVHSREDAYTLLEKTDKAHLTALAQEFKIHLLKSDTRLKITKKIVESIVGSRLRSDAIRETSLTGGS